MNIRSIKHRGLRRLIEDDDPREIRGDLVNRTRNILTTLIVASDMAGVQGPPGWRIHELTGDRSGTWSISVSGNWRITFTLLGDEIADLNMEDYH
jgi:proteic killer suppression protein